MDSALEGLTANLTAIFVKAIAIGFEIAPPARRSGLKFLPRYSRDSACDWPLDSRVMVQLTAGTKRRLQLLFRREECDQAEKVLVDECGDNLRVSVSLEETSFSRGALVGLRLVRMPGDA